MATTHIFGSGRLIVKDPTGQAYQIGTLQGVSLTFEGSTKELYGNKQFPVAVAATQKKVTGKADFAMIDGRLINTVFGGTKSSGRKVIYEESTSGASLAVAHSATFVADLGVMDAGGEPMDLVASNPEVGEYAVAAGTYTFNAAETGTKTVTYQATVADGETITVDNELMGVNATYNLFIQEEFDDEQLGLEFTKVVIPNLEMSFKNDDFAVENLSFSCQADDSGNVFYVYLG